VRDKPKLGLLVKGWADAAMPIVTPEPGGAAERAGFVDGDVLLTVNEISARKFLSVEWRTEAIVGLDVKVLRDGNIVSLRLDLPTTDQVAQAEKTLAPQAEADQPELRVLFRPGRNRQQFPADGVPNDAHQQIELVDFFQDDLSLT
jgi:predicted metalloprotease with PDZ domain